MPDAIVVGAGIVGAATALELATAGLSVLILEGDFAGAGSTGAAMGHLVVMDDSDAQMALCKHSRKKWTQLRGSFDRSAEMERTGTLWLAATDGELGIASAKADKLLVNGIRAEVLDPRQLAKAEPSLRSELSGALRVPDDMVCYPPAIARILVERAVDKGAKLVSGTKAIAVESGVVRLVSGDCLRAPVIVVAAGAHSSSLVAGLPVVPRRGHLLITDRTSLPVNHQLIELGYLDSAHSMGGASVAFNVQPRRTGQLLIGSSRELVGLDRKLNRPLVGRMLSRAIDFVPGLATVSASRAWFGFRPATPDALPLIGKWPALEGVWIATGHEGLGITMATGTAELITADVMNSEPPLDPTPYLPNRTMPKMEVVA